MRQLLLQLAVLGGCGGVVTKGVAEGKPRSPVRRFMIDRMQVMGPVLDIGKAERQAAQFGVIGLRR